jgi:adenosine deaminase
MHWTQRIAVLSLIALATVIPASAQTHSPSLPEQRAASAFDRAKASGPLALNSFLVNMPKGGELHFHLSGAVYAETFLKDAAEDNLCVNPATLTLTKNTGLTGTQPMCAAGEVPAASAFHDQRLYDSLVDGFSMRNFVPTPGLSGHDQFFATFARFGAIGDRHTGEWLDEVATRAAAQNEQYLEIMQLPNLSKTLMMGAALNWPLAGPAALQPVTTAASSAPDDLAGTTPAELAAMRDKLLAMGLREQAAANDQSLAQAQADRNRREQCGAAAATAACSVEIRFQYAVLRGFPPQIVFAQLLLGFEMAAQDPHAVGVNLVQPEDAYLPMSEYHRQMLMLDFLHGLYPSVHIDLHAGELAPGLVPPAGLRFHIRQAIELGHAERIGHGTDVLYETNPQQLLQQMAARHIAVEINLTSNDVILGIKASQHPFPLYRAAGVPTVLSTDDEGVSRIGLTHEYVRAALEFPLSYRDLKELARNAIAYSFLPGQELWTDRGRYQKVVPACGAQPLGSETPSAACAAFLRANPHAAQEWELERRFHKFESSIP